MNLRKIAICVICLSFTFNLFAQNCVCPNINMTAPSELLRSGDVAVFTVEVKGNKEVESTYNWAVSNGTIISGQGTPVISVDTKGLGGTNITVAVKIGGWCAECNNLTASETAEIMPDPKPILVDKFTRGNCEDVLARMDNFFNELNNNPNASGYFIAYGKTRIVATAEREARNWIKIRRFDPSRITIVRGGGDSDKAEVEMWLVPAGANPPEITSLPATVVQETPKAVTEPTKPYIFSSQYSDSIAGCGNDDGSGIDLEGFAQMLKENPKYRGNILIMSLTKAGFREQEKEILQFLTKKGIARKRLKTFHQKVFGGIELWILP